MTSVTSEGIGRGRRTNGEGTYDTLPSGKVRLRVAVGDGQRLTFIGTSKQDCAAQLRKAHANQRDGRLVTSSRATVGDWLDQWLSDHIEPNSKESPRTYEAYESAVRVRIKPGLGGQFGRIQLGKLSGPHIQRLYAELSKKYAPKTASFTHEILHLSLEAARRARLISHNPTDDVTAPKRGDRNADARALTEAQILILDRAMVGHAYEPIWRFLLGTGLRWGEAAALHWSDVDLTPGREQVRVTRAATRVPVKLAERLGLDIDGGHKIKAPKTIKGRRAIPLPPDTITALTAQRERCRKLKADAAPGEWSIADGDLIFPNENGRILRSNYPLVEFKKVLLKAGLPPKRLHDLRHSYATVLFRAGIHPRIAQELLGHARIEMTLGTYTSSIEAVNREAVMRAFGTG